MPNTQVATACAQSLRLRYNRTGDSWAPGRRNEQISGKLKKNAVVQVLDVWHQKLTVFGLPNVIYLFWAGFSAQTIAFFSK